MIRGLCASMTVIVSCALLATKARRPSGETTTFHGSAPVVRLRTRWARSVPLEALRIRMTVTLLPAALATKA